MAVTLSQRTDRLKDGLVRAAIGLTVSGARRIPAFRERVLSAVARRLRRAYVENEPNEDLLAIQLWFGRSLKPFLIRLLDERPRAAKKLIHLAYVWARDVERRTRTAEGGVVTPATVVLEPTSRCNLNCPGCYAKSTAAGDDPPYDILRRIVAEAREMGVTLVTLSGGEPFLREAGDRAITRLAGDFPNLGFLVYTNATLINADVARRLGDLGNVFPAISVEGHERESDARRGAGYYRGARRVRDLLAKHEVLYGFSGTVTRANADLLSSDEFIARRIEEGDLFGWYFLLQPIGRNPDTSLLVTSEQRAHLRDQIFKWRAEGKPIFIGDFWNDGLLVGGCIAAGRYYFHIYANGDISPCVFSPIACGNVFEILSGRSEYRSLADFVNRHPFFVRFREKQKSIADWRAPCLLLDHPEHIRDVCAHAEWFAGPNMPAGYLEGTIARAVDEAARSWNAALRRMPLVPDCVRGAGGAAVREHVAGGRGELAASGALDARGGGC